MLNIYRDVKNEKKVVVFGIVLTIGLTFPACGPQKAQQPPIATYTVEPAYTPTVSHTVEPSVPSQATTALPPATATIPPTLTSTIVPIDTREPPSLPFSERGPYWTGNRVYTFVDDIRNDRKIDIQIYYPALKQANDSGGTITRNAIADMSGAAYPLILTGANSGDYLLKSHLASYGFVMAIVRSPDPFYTFDFQVMDFPLDFIFVLDQISLNPLEGLEGVIDSDNTGATGYSGDGFTSLAVSGIRIDPEFYLSYCDQAPVIEPPLPGWYINLFCGLAKKWDAFVDHVGTEFTDSDDGLWQPVTDERIRAVMPMAVDGAWFYGERGLAMVDLPVLFIQATEDDAYQPIEAAFIFEHLGTPEKFMISFIGKDHDMVYQTEPANRMKHFAVAFFGYYLQGHEDYAYYFSEDFVAKFDDLAWGIYIDEN
jgi:predicted dienelactone hydrolase